MNGHPEMEAMPRIGGKDPSLLEGMPCSAMQWVPCSGVEAIGGVPRSELTEDGKPWTAMWRGRATTDEGVPCQGRLWCNKGL